jgi:hypothetical protein
MCKIQYEIDNLKNMNTGNNGGQEKTLDDLLDSINLFNNLPKALVSMDIADKHEFLFSISP